MHIQKAKETTRSKAKTGINKLLEKHCQLTLQINVEELITFSEKIGFRYCCHKAQRLQAEYHIVNFVMKQIDKPSG